MEIRHAALADLNSILKIYEQARTFMRQQGNLNQWTNGYPQRELIEKDIQNNNCYVCVSDSEIVGVFCYFHQPDPTYAHIYEGSWLNDAPYGVIHRIAVTSHRKGIANACYDFALSKCPNLVPPNISAKNFALVLAPSSGLTINRLFKSIFSFSSIFL